MAICRFDNREGIPCAVVQDCLVLCSIELELMRRASLTRQSMPSSLRFHISTERYELIHTRMLAHALLQIQKEAEIVTTQHSLTRSLVIRIRVPPCRPSASLPNRDADQLFLGVDLSVYLSENVLTV